MNKYFKEILLRDLQTLKLEIEAFKKDGDLWLVEGQITNSAGNLALHICGNLNHFIGAGLGKTGYVRNRDLEFSLKNISKTEIIAKIDGTFEMIKTTFLHLTEQNLEEKYPSLFLGKEVKKGELLLILTSHLAYHLGQINYLRRMISK